MIDAPTPSPAPGAQGGSSANRAGEPASREATERFAALVERQGSDGKAAKEPATRPRRQARMGPDEGSTAPALAPAAEQPRVLRDGKDAGQRQDAPGPAIARGDAPAAAVEAAVHVTVASDPVHAAMVERVAAPDGASGETLLSMPDTRWLAREAVIVQADGGLMLSLDMNGDPHGASATTEELRRRLEARGIGVEGITVRASRSGQDCA